MIKDVKRPRKNRASTVQGQAQGLKLQNVLEVRLMLMHFASLSVHAKSAQVRTKGQN